MSGGLGVGGESGDWVLGRKTTEFRPAPTLGDWMQIF